MRSVCESCGGETTNKIKASCNHLCLICKECVETSPNIERDECPTCQEREDVIFTRGRFDDGCRT